mgnify:CR=1 FL=1
MIGKIVQGADFRGVVNYVMLKPDAEPLLVISICMRSSASIFCGISFRFLPQIYPSRMFQILGQKSDINALKAFYFLHLP